MNTTAIDVRTSSAAYRVEIGSGLLSAVGSRMAELLGERTPGDKQRFFIVSSPEIWKLHGASLTAGLPAEPTLLLVPSGEHHKRLARIERLAEQLAGAGADRDSVLIAFGGGVIGDMTGFLAAIYMRGIRYVQVPTTLLAQVDSALGGKTGVNLGVGKNLIGSFHHPLAVFADTQVLATLPPADLRAGLQECVKAGIIRDRALFDLLETRRAEILRADPATLFEVIAASVRVKADIVAEDETEREGGVRLLLNFGHTLGHAIEAATGYTQLLHGEAVAWGMLAAIDIARKRGLVTQEEALHMQRVIRAYGPLRPFAASAVDLVALTAKDKKNRGGARAFVLPVGIGNATVVHDVSEAELTIAAETLVAAAASGSAA